MRKGRAFICRVLNVPIDCKSRQSEGMMSAEFGDESFVITLTVLSAVLVICFLGFQILIAPNQRYIVMYLASEDGKALSQDATVLHQGDQLRIQVIFENHMACQIRLKLETFIASNLSSDPTTSDGVGEFRLQDQDLILDDGGTSTAPMMLTVTRARAEGDSIIIEEVEMNGVKSPVIVESSLRNQTLRFIFRALVWSDVEGKYVPEWSDGQSNHSSWLQIWFELLPGDGS